MVAPITPSNGMDTSQQINHVFGCLGEQFHLTPGFMLLRQQDPSRCPRCGAGVYDASDTPIGAEYLRQAKFIREDKQP